ncbi:MAG: hypothetical protein BA861_11250 [Desulfobacterales bacterium S3730MH5]|nr:MAG: hypothetical protein BA861_11250 [Desulfobacterales bacterium S3730MH5]
MMKKGTLIVLAFVLSVVFLFPVAYAAEEVAEVIIMESPVFEKHKKALVPLTHKKHNEEYGIACAECHHVYEDGKNVWKEGDAVQKCSACHSEAKAPKAKKGEPKLTKQEKIKMFYYSAIHENCVACHKAAKKEGKAAPTKCAECHPKKKK